MIAMFLISIHIIGLISVFNAINIKNRPSESLTSFSTGSKARTMKEVYTNGSDTSNRFSKFSGIVARIVPAIKIGKKNGRPLFGLPVLHCATCLHASFSGGCEKFFGTQGPKTNPSTYSGRESPRLCQSFGGQARIRSSKLQSTTAGSRTPANIRAVEEDPVEPGPAAAEGQARHAAGAAAGTNGVHVVSRKNICVSTDAHDLGCGGAKTFLRANFLVGYFRFLAEPRSAVLDIEVVVKSPWNFLDVFDPGEIEVRVALLAVVPDHCHDAVVAEVESGDNRGERQVAVRDGAGLGVVQNFHLAVHLHLDNLFGNTEPFLCYDLAVEQLFQIAAHHLLGVPGGLLAGGRNGAVDIFGIGVLE